MSDDDSFALFPDELLECEVESSDLESSKSSVDFRTAIENTHELLYSACFFDGKENDFGAIFPDVELDKEEDDSFNVFLEKALLEYPLLSPQFLQNVEEASPSASKHTSPSSNDSHASHLLSIAGPAATPSAVDKQMKPIQSSGQMPFKAFLHQFYPQCIMIPCPSENTNRAYFLEKHKDLHCMDSSNGIVNFRVVYDAFRRSTGWAIPVTTDESVLEELKAMYPGWRGMTMEDVELACSKEKALPYDGNGVKNTDTTTSPSSTTVCANSPEQAMDAPSTRSSDNNLCTSTTGHVHPSSSAIGTDGDRTSSSRDLYALKYRRIVASLLQDEERFLRALDAAGGLEKAVFVCVDVELAFSSNSYCSFPLEISLVPFTISTENKDFSPLSKHCCNRKPTALTSPQAGGNDTKQFQPPFSVDGATVSRKYIPSTLLTGKDSFHRSSSSICKEGTEGEKCDHHSTRTDQTEEKNSQCTKQQENHLTTQNEYHCFVYSGNFNTLSRDTSVYSSACIHGIPHNASFLRKDYKTIQKELDFFLSNPSCILVAKGGCNSPPMSDMNAIRFIYAAAAAQEKAEAAAVAATGIPPTSYIPEKGSHDSHGIMPSLTPPLYVDEMRFFNSVMVEKVLSTYFLNNPKKEVCSSHDNSKKKMNGTEVEGKSKNNATKVSKSDVLQCSVINDDDGHTLEDSMDFKDEKDNSSLADENEMKGIFDGKLRRCWYHERFTKIPPDSFLGLQSSNFHCARRDAWILGHRLEKCACCAITRKKSA